MSKQIAKINASKEALKFVQNGMIVGLGTGTTAKIFINLLGKKISENFQITGMPTSIETKKQAEKLGIKLIDINDKKTIDLAIDGADEVSPQKNLIKGLGGAFLREKIVEKKADNLIIIVDESKMVKKLGKGILPIEVDKEKYLEIVPKIEAYGCSTKLRKENNGDIFKTDNGNFIYHCKFDKEITNAIKLETELMAINGVIDTGLFINMANMIIIGNKEGTTIID